MDGVGERRDGGKRGREGEREGERAKEVVWMALGRGGRESERKEGE